MLVQVNINQKDVVMSGEDLELMKKKRKEDESLFNQVAALINNADMEELKRSPEYKAKSKADAEFERKLDSEGVSLDDINSRTGALEAMTPMIVQAASGAFDTTGLPRTSSNESEVNRITTDFANQRKITEELFPKHDANGDGRLNRQEYNELKIAMSATLREESMKELASTIMEASNLKPFEPGEIKIPDAFKVVRGEMDMDEYVDATIANAKAAIEARQTSR